MRRRSCGCCSSDGPLWRASSESADRLAGQLEAYYWGSSPSRRTSVRLTDELSQQRRTGDGAQYTGEAGRRPQRATLQGRSAAGAWQWLADVHDSHSLPAAVASTRQAEQHTAQVVRHGDRIVRAEGIRSRNADLAWDAAAQ